MQNLQQKNIEIGDKHEKDTEWLKNTIQYLQFLYRMLRCECNQLHFALLIIWKTKDVVEISDIIGAFIYNVDVNDYKLWHTFFIFKFPSTVTFKRMARLFLALTVETTRFKMKT